MENMTHDQIRKVLDIIEGDGHTIFKVEPFEDLLPPAWLKRLTQTFKSSKTDPKEMLFVDGKRVDSLRGIYGLDVLRAIGAQLDAQILPCFGRGTEARRWDEAIRAKLILAQIDA